MPASHLVNCSSYSGTSLPLLVDSPAGAYFAAFCDLRGRGCGSGPIPVCLARAWPARSGKSSFLAPTPPT